MIFVIFNQNFMLMLNGKLYWSDWKQHRLWDDVLQDLIIYNYQSFTRHQAYTIVISTERISHWGRVTHICVSKLIIIGWDNGSSPGRRQAIIWSNDGILLIWFFGTKFSDILIEIHIFSFEKMHLNMSSAKCRPFRLGLNVIYHKHTHSVVLL